MHVMELKKTVDKAHKHLEQQISQLDQEEQNEIKKKEQERLDAIEKEIKE